mgnify:CR=1 FL=1
MYKVLVEAIVVALLVIVIGCLIAHLLGEKCNRNLVIILFLTGIVTHLICEYTGVNKWYCKKGHACLK